jgi:hypothetical protein
MEPQGRQATTTRLARVLSRSPVLVFLGALAAVGALFVFLVLPPPPASIDISAWRDLAAVTAAGAYHIHTTRSDGAGDRATVASAARRAGLQFVIITDHGDGTRPTDPPEYIDGVLCLDGVEISTDDGHYVALDMRRAAYPLGGAGDAVIEDVRRFGGFGVVAHPDSPKTGLEWTDSYDGIDGIEWLNADSEWRKESRGNLIRAGAAYPFRPGPALATLFDRPSTLDRWDRLTTERPVVALAAVDAHGGVHQSAAEGQEGERGLPGIPSYEASFKTITNRVVLDAPLSGDAPSDARAIYAAIRAGRVFSTVNAVASPALLDFHLESSAGLVPMGSLAAAPDSATFVARAPMPEGSTMILLRDGREVDRSGADTLRVQSAGRGAYRIEIHAPGAPGHPPVPWVVSNPIYVGITPRRVVVPLATVAAEGTAAPFPWRIEKDPTSSATLRTTAHNAELQYTLGPGRRASQYVALAADVQLESRNMIRLGLEGDRQMRVSVQLRDGEGARWGRSFYVDPQGTTITARPADMRPIGQDAPAVFDAQRIRSLLLVIDLTNAVPAQSGTLRVLNSEVVR